MRGLVPLHGTCIFASKFTLRAGVGHLAGVSAHMPPHVGTKPRGVRTVRTFVGVLRASVHAVEGHLQPLGTLRALIRRHMYSLTDQVCIFQVRVHLSVPVPTARYPWRPARPLQRAQSDFRMESFSVYLQGKSSPLSGIDPGITLLSLLSQPGIRPPSNGLSPSSSTTVKDDM